VSDHEDDERLLSAATSALRAHTDSGWRAARPGVLDRVRRAVRPSAPVRGRHGAGEFTVASGVLATRVAAVVDRSPAASARRVSCVADAHQELETVLVELAVEFGAELLSVSREVRSSVLAEVERLIGYRIPESVVVVDVHVADVFKPPPRPPVY